jgi:hypothetical protein
MDPAQETKDHIERVRDLIAATIADLRKRSLEHDASKLIEPEKSVFDTMSQTLKGITYGSDEYRAKLREMKPAIDHHYAANRHHPEHWTRGLYDMSLLDILEMLCDWKAATERMKDGGDLKSSILINRERFEMDELLTCILMNTAKEMGWLKHEKP